MFHLLNLFAFISFLSQTKINAFQTDHANGLETTKKLYLSCVDTRTCNQLDIDTITITIDATEQVKYVVSLRVHRTSISDESSI